MRKRWLASSLLALSLTVGVLPVYALSGGWHYEQGDQGRSGYSPEAVVSDSGRLLWTSTVDPWYGSMYSGPVVGEGLIFAAGRDNKLYALHRDTGAVVWSAAVPGYYVPGVPAYDAARGLVYVTASTSPAGKLFAFRASDGTLVWTATTTGQYAARDSSPVVVGNTVVVAAGGSGNTVYGFDTATGRQLWQQKTNGGYVAAAAGDRVFVGAVNGQIYTFRASDGAAQWSRLTGSSGGSRIVPVAGAGRIFVGDYGRVAALDEATGAVLWERTGTKTVANGPMALAEGVLWVSEYGGLAALDAATGATLRQVTFCGTNYVSAPVVSSTHVMAPCNDGKIYSVNRTTYAVSTLADGRGPLALDGSRLYFAKTAGSSQYRLAALESAQPAVPTRLTVSASGPAQYSDLVTLTATLVREDGTPVAGAPVQFAAGGTALGTAVTDDQGRANLPYTVALSAGVYKVTANYAGDTGANLAASAGAMDLSVMPEVATITTVTPDMADATAGSAITLTARLAEEADGHSGDLSQSVVSFRVLDELQAVAATVVAPVTAAGDGTGIASASVPMLGEGLYTVEVEVQSWGQYVAAHVASPLVVYTPVDGQRVSGGGWVLTDGQRSNVGLNVGYSTGNNGLKGSLLFMFHDKASQRLLKVQAKQWNTLAVVGNQAIAIGNATVRSVGPVHSKAKEHGNTYTVELAVSDGGQQGPDTFEITVKDGSGAVFHQAKGTLEGGQVQVVSP